jgi:hypothetical protein
MRQQRRHQTGAYKSSDAVSKSGCQSVNGVFMETTSERLPAVPQAATPRQHVKSHRATQSPPRTFPHEELFLPLSLIPPMAIGNYENLQCVGRRTLAIAKPQTCMALRQLTYSRAILPGRLHDPAAFRVLQTTNLAGPSLADPFVILLSSSSADSHVRQTKRERCP